MVNEHCKRCRYYLGHDLGTCRRFPVYQTRSQNEWCGEFAVAKPLPEPDSGVFSHVTRELIDLPVLSESPKKKGRPKKNV
jgi:hypothetical protein